MKKNTLLALIVSAPHLPVMAHGGEHHQSTFFSVFMHWLGHIDHLGFLLGAVAVGAIALRQYLRP